MKEVLSLLFRSLKSKSKEETPDYKGRINWEESNTVSLYKWINLNILKKGTTELCVPTNNRVGWTMGLI